MAGMNKDTSNSISKSNHAASTHSLKTSGTICIDSAAGEGQTCANNDFGQGNEAMITSRAGRGGKLECVFGTFHSLPAELQETIIVAAKCGASKIKKSHDVALAAQKAAHLKKEEIAHKKKIDITQEEYIVAMEFWEQYHSPCRCTTASMAMSVYNQLKSETARLNAVKKQILIGYSGLGWEDAHHPWSSQGVVFNSQQLLNHLIEKVIPMTGQQEVPSEPLINFPEPLDMMILGTESELTFVYKFGTIENIQELKTSAASRSDTMEAEGTSDCWAARQQSIMPVVNSELIGFKIEMLFRYNNEDGTTYVNWCNGVIISILNEKSYYVKVRWNQECLGQGEPNITKEKLLASNWNPNKAAKGAWREYFGSD